ncbi:hypothetical protein [Arthrobacter sp. UM1]|uniref:hypothetical protein n=1 Tax=Arthrobacter sp. UM1 TaxID=2766776 RepID=UPI001CF645D4|nr:hypothetical protein [Arthrobacter sp. UM1]MCB4207746.1 hypothetical protein [Arthrobacter sp. UM1]
MDSCDQASRGRRTRRGRGGADRRGEWTGWAALAVVAFLGLVVAAWAISSITAHGRSGPAAVAGVVRFLKEHRELAPWAVGMIAFAAMAVQAWTNVSRSREAVNKEFRESLQWALGRVNESDDAVERNFALGMILAFRAQPPRMLSQSNKRLVARAVRDLALMPVVTDQRSDALPGAALLGTPKEDAEHE